MAGYSFKNISMSARNKRAGSNHERDEVKRYKKYFNDVVTTRSCNRARDGEGIDLCNKDELEVGRLPFDVSCKSSTKAAIPYVKLLKALKPGRIKVIHHRHTVKSTGGKFMVKGEYVIMESEGFEQLLQHAYAVQVLREMAPAAIKVLENMYGLKLLDFLNQLPKPNDNNTTNNRPPRKILGSTTGK